MMQTGRRRSVLICGFGSIGKRHFRNLRSSFPHYPVAVYDPRRDQLAQAPEDVQKFSEWSAAWDWGPEVVFVCSPSSLHLSTAQEALNRGCHVFIEKPLSHSEDGLLDFVRRSEKTGLTVQVGANMRYHPGPKMLKRLLDDGAIKQLFAVTTCYGGYLPDWHPQEDYRTLYSARRELGGGVLLDAIHEIDTALWFLGTPVAVSGMIGRTGLLDIETEDQARILIRGEGGAIADIKLDYLQKPTQRSYTLIGEGGRLDWDINLPGISVLSRDGARQVIPIAPELLQAANRPYLNQLDEFIECIETGRRPMVGPAAGALAVLVALAAKRSSENCLGIPFEEDLLHLQDTR